jgi:hypothetical protein
METAGLHRKVRYRPYLANDRKVEPTLERRRAISVFGQFPTVTQVSRKRGLLEQTARDLHDGYHENLQMSKPPELIRRQATLVY